MIQILQQYLNAIDVEKGKVIQKLLPLYRLGLRTHKKIFRQLQIHSGYWNTVRRYMTNRNVLTQQQINNILSLYDIRNIPNIPSIIYNRHILTFIPEARVFFNVLAVQLRIISVPEPRVFWDALPIRLSIAFVPEPRILFTTPAVIQRPITGVPEPRVMFVAPQIGQQFPMTFVPEPRVVNQIQTAGGARIFFGVDGAVSRPIFANFAALNPIVIDPIPADITLIFANTLGFYIIAIPVSAPVRNEWFVDNLNRGAIGGAIDPVFGNAWPEPVIQIHETVSYNVYIGNYRTIFSTPITFRRV